MIRLMLVGVRNRCEYGAGMWKGHESIRTRRRVYVGDDSCLPLVLSGPTSWVVCVGYR